MIRIMLRMNLPLIKIDEVKEGKLQEPTERKKLKNQLPKLLKVNVTSLLPSEGLPGIRSLRTNDLSSVGVDGEAVWKVKNFLSLENLKT